MELRLLNHFSIFISLVLSILIFILAISFHDALKYLGKNEAWHKKIGKIHHFLKYEPAHLFASLAERDKNGTYLLPYETYKRLHILSKKTLLRTFGLVFVQLTVIFFLIYGLTLYGHFTIAFGGKSQENNNLTQQLNQ